MKRRQAYSIFLVLILFFTSCTKEQLTTQKGDPATLSLSIDSRADLSAENKVEHIRVLTFGALGGSAVGSLDINSGMIGLPVSGKVTTSLNTGVRDIHVISNEGSIPGLSARLDAVRNITDLKNISIPYNGTITPPFLGHYLNEAVEISKENTSAMKAEMVRTVSKVNLTINYMWGVGNPLLEEIVIDKVQVKHLPEYSYLIGKKYDGSNYVNSEILEGAILNNQPTATSTYTSKPLVIYIPEFLDATHDNYAYLEIKAHIKSTGIVCTYKLPIANAMNGTGAITNGNYSIVRNTSFNVNATIKSFGEAENMTVKVKVLPWNVVNQNDETGRFITLDKATDAADKPIADGSNLDDTGATLKVVCNTDIGGWYTVTRDMNNKIVHKSSPTASVSGATSQTIKVTIPELVATAYGQNFTVSIYHPIIAMESVGPIKVLKYTQYGGFIPNSVLIAAGWPADKLPANGLQLAKRGNQRLPSGVADTLDQERKWKIVLSVTAGVETIDDFAQAKLGMGKGSTDAMVATSALAAEHIAANYCREMGPDWYLPSVAELVLIYNNHSTFGASYTFGATTLCWSATQLDTSVGWFVYFSSGDPFKVNKTFPNGVRCVREI